LWWLFISGIPWAFELEPMLLNFSIHGFDSGTACGLHKFTDDIQLGGAVIVLNDAAAMGGTLTS